MRLCALLSLACAYHLQAGTALPHVDVPGERLASFLRGLAPAATDSTHQEAGSACLLTVDGRDEILKQMALTNMPKPDGRRPARVGQYYQEQVGGEVEDEGEDNGGIATTQRRLTSGTRALPTACAFEGSNWCGWSYDEDYAWTREIGPTPSSGTGPSADHTTGAGYYAVVESSIYDSSYSQLLSNVGPFTLESPELSGGSGGVLIEFYYHMYGSTMGTLQLDTFNGFAWTTQWNRTGDQGQDWNLGSVQITTEVTRVRFVGTTGDSYLSDIAIDDVAIMNAPPSAAPTFSPVPSPSPSLSSPPTLERTPSPTTFNVQARTWSELNDALQVDRTVVNVTDDILFAQSITLDGGQDVIAFCNATAQQQAASLGGTYFCATFDGGGETKLFSISDGARLRLTRLRITNGYGTRGGAFYIDGGEAHLTGCTVNNNEAFDFGGVFYVEQTSYQSIRRRLTLDCPATCDGFTCDYWGRSQTATGPAKSSKRNPAVTAPDALVRQRASYQWWNFQAALSMTTMHFIKAAFFI